MEIHVYNTNNGEYISSLSGDIDMLMLNIKEGQDFTLESLPYSEQPIKWSGTQWEAIDISNENR